MKPVRLALIGAGSMGAKHAAAIADSRHATLVAVIDIDPERAAALAARYGAAASTDLASALTCDAAIVAAATDAHATAALALIDAGLHVLVEKPLTGSLAETRQVIAAAARRDVVLMCGLVERFNPAFVEMCARFRNGVTHVEAARIGPPPRRVHSSVVDDVLLHDLDLVLALAGDNAVVDLCAAALDVNRSTGWPETVSCRLAFANGMTASLVASRAGDARRRAFTIVHGGGAHHLDLLDPPGDPLRHQLDRFVELIGDSTDLTRQAERLSVLPSHELAHRIHQDLSGTLCIA